MPASEGIETFPFEDPELWGIENKTNPGQNSVENSPDFDGLKVLIGVLAQEIFDANAEHCMFHGLVDHAEEFEREFHQHNTYWGLVFNSLQESRLLHLCRVYDTHNEAVSIRKLLCKMTENFDTLPFDAKIVLHPESRKSLKQELENDIRLVGNQNVLVKKLEIWRNKVFAHRDIRVSLGQDEILGQSILSKSDVETLIGKAHSILNKYLRYLHLPSETLSFAGADDYLDLLRTVRISINERITQNERQ